MELDDTKIIQKYNSIREIVIEIEKKLNNLRNIKGEIPPERFEPKEKEYLEILAREKPKLEKLRDEIEARIREYSAKIDEIHAQEEPLEIELGYEQKLYKAEAISKEEYKAKSGVLERKLNDLRAKAKKLNKNMLLLKQTISEKSSARKPISGSHYSIPKRSPSDFKEDFWSGAKVLLLVIFGLAILGAAWSLVPILVWPVALVLLVTLFFATLGRILRFIKEKW